MSAWRLNRKRPDAARCTGSCSRNHRLNGYGSWVQAGDASSAKASGYACRGFLNVHLATTHVDAPPGEAE